MIESQKIPIKKKTTGEITWSDPAKVQTEYKRHPEYPNSRPDAPDEFGENSGRNDEPLSGHDQGEVKQPSARTPEGGNPPAGSKKKPRPEIENLEQFILYAYSRSGQRITLRRSVEKALCRNPKLEAEARERLLQKAKGDFLLAVPRQLLLVFRDVVGYPTLKNEVRSFVGDVLAGHPVFLLPELAAVLKNLPDAPDPERALMILTTTDFSTFSVPTGHKPLKRGAFDELRSNAAYCLVVWFSETRGVSFEKLNQYLFSSLWNPKARIIKDETARLRVLTELRDLAGVGLACSTFKRQADDRAQIAESAKRAEDAALEQLKSLHASINELSQELGEQDRRVSELAAAVEAEKRNHEHTRTHLRDDYEQLRTRLLRRLKAGAELLSEGLHALRRDEPKIHVMDDHAERTLDALKKEIQYLESENRYGPGGV